MRLDLKTAAGKIEALAREYNMELDPRKKVGELAVGERQRVEIIKALFRGARILILDEPTAVLTPQETGELFNMIRSLTAKGFTVLFISHKLNEVKEISNRVTVLRLGRTCAPTTSTTAPSATWPADGGPARSASTSSASSRSRARPCSRSGTSRSSRRAPPSRRSTMWT